jgi:dihydrofolate reductase
MIVAVDTDWCIGKDGMLLEYIPEDMKFFKETTMNKIIIMGSKTQNSFPNKTCLKNRINIILTKHSNRYFRLSNETDYNAHLMYLPDICEVHDCIELMKLQRLTKNTPINNINYLPDNISDSDVFIIGGAQVYKQFLENDLIDTVYLTKFYNKYNGDVFIPNLYDLGFKETEVLVPKTLSKKGIMYSISILKK